jgi:metal-sulfur cluster biosynthetic enzyme
MNALDIAHALADVRDPELGIDFVALGLIYGIKVEGLRIMVELATTSALCPMGDLMIADAGFVLRTRFPDFEVDVRRVDSPSWDLRMVSEEALVWLGMGARA